MQQLQAFDKLASAAGRFAAGIMAGAGADRDAETQERLLNLRTMPAQWRHASDRVAQQVPAEDLPAFLQDLAASRRWCAATECLDTMRAALDLMKSAPPGPEAEQDVGMALERSFSVLLDAIEAALWMRQALQRAFPRWPA
jgi:hypothetical protein